MNKLIFTTIYNSTYNVKDTSNMSRVISMSFMTEYTLVFHEKSHNLE